MVRRRRLLGVRLMRGAERRIRLRRSACANHDFSTSKRISGLYDRGTGTSLGGDMRRSVLFLAAAVIGCGGCGGSGVPPSNGDTGGNGGSDAGAPPSTDAGDTTGPADRLIDLPQFTLNPGEEKTLCAYVPSDGVERYVHRFVTEMTPGSHHLLAFGVADNGGPASVTAEPCKDLLPSNMYPGAQQPHTDIALPDGIGWKIPAKQAMYFQMHYINAGQTMITAHVTYRLVSMPQAQVQQLAGEIFYGQWRLDIPTGVSTQSMTCHAPQDLKLLLSTGHMHMHGTAFDASVAGQNVFHTNNWDAPDWTTYPAPGYDVKSGDEITWACTYDNETGAPLHFGTSASKNEMCILTALYWPAPNSATLFLCQ
jgi:hypothetical protein